MKNNVHAKAKHRRQNIAVFGAITIIFAIIGLVSTTIFTVNFVRSIFSDEERLEHFENIILPLVILDPPPFDSVENLDMSIQIQASIWSTLLNENRIKYEDEATGVLTIPIVDIDSYAKKMFGPETVLVHQSVGDILLSYTYDEELQAYIVPVMGKVQLYTPRVESYTQDGDIYTLTVGYIPPGGVWELNEEGERTEITADKNMTYILEKVEDNYYITGVYIGANSGAEQGQSGESVPTNTEPLLPENEESDDVASDPVAPNEDAIQGSSSATDAGEESEEPSDGESDASSSESAADSEAEEDSSTEE